MRSPLTVQTENVALGKGHVVIVLTVPKGIDKPYFDNSMVTYDELAHLTGKGRSSVMRIIADLKTAGRLERIGSKKRGIWKIIE